MVAFKTAKQTGDLMGLSVKALRLYETRGLVSPGRTSAGWRVYGPDEFARLHKVQTLKSIGFSLAEIASLIEGGVELAAILETQTKALARQQERLSHARHVVAKAQARLRDGHILSTDDLINLTQETDMSEFEWTEAHEALAARHYTKDQRDAFAAKKMTPEFQAEMSAKWESILADAERLRHGPPDTPEAIEFGRRWKAAAAMFSEGDTSVDQATSNWYEDGFSNPETAKLMPFSKEVWEFAKAAIIAGNAQDGIV
ncbi:MAG: MerR family transcriptional regulator [Hyphomonadaceae bacterium]